jgi:hypothetical protein
VEIIPGKPYKLYLKSGTGDIVLGKPDANLLNREALPAAGRGDIII